MLVHVLHLSGSCIGSVWLEAVSFLRPPHFGSANLPAATPAAGLKISHHHAMGAIAHGMHQGASLSPALQQGVTAGTGMSGADAACASGGSGVEAQVQGAQGVKGFARPGLVMQHTGQVAHDPHTAQLSALRQPVRASARRPSATQGGRIAAAFGRAGYSTSPAPHPTMAASFPNCPTGQLPQTEEVPQGSHSSCEKLIVGSHQASEALADAHVGPQQQPCSGGSGTNFASQESSMGGLQPSRNGQKPTIDLPMAPHYLGADAAQLMAWPFLDSAADIACLLNSPGRSIMSFALPLKSGGIHDSAHSSPGACFLPNQ